MSELTDALIQLFGPRSGLVLVVLLAADALQTKYLNGRFNSVEDQVDDVKQRVTRVEDVHIATDGGENSD